MPDPRQVTLQWLRVEARFQSESDKGGYSAYSLFVRGGNVAVEACTLVAGNALAGSDGSLGATGPAGKPGVTATDLALARQQRGGHLLTGHELRAGGGDVAPTGCGT